MEIASLTLRQRRWFSRGDSRSWAFRHDALRRLHAAVTAERTALVDSLYADLRKGPHEAASSEIAFVLAEIDFALRHLKRWMKPQRRPAPLMAWPSAAYLQAEPLGLGLILGPWNYPVQLSLVPLVGAIAAGGCAIVKPSELASQTSAVLTRMLQAAFPPEHIAVLEGGPEVAQSLLEEQFDTVFFTGGTETGRKVMTAAARHLTPVTLELGGKCPCVVTADADVELAGRRIAWGKMLNAGQTCVAPDYVFVDQTCRDRLIDSLHRSLLQFFGEDPRQSPHFGRLVNRLQFMRAMRCLGHGTVVHGGDSDANDLYIAPTLLVDVPLESPAMTEEIFAPILPVLSVVGLDEAISLIQRSGAPLAAYLFSQNASDEARFIESIRAGGICVNDVVVQAFGRHLPFGGVGASGTGRYHGRASFDAFSNMKTIVRGSRRLDFAWRYPPTQLEPDRLERIVRFLLRR